MLITDDILFIHPPKTAGMSVTAFLIRNLPGQKLLTVPEGHSPDDPSVTALPGIRHENLPQAVERLAELGRELEQFRFVIAIIRNPYAMEVSRFHYLRLGHPWDAGPLQKLALAGDFDSFAREAP